MRSSVPWGQEHNGSSVAATELQPSGGVPREGWQGETKVHRVHPVSRTVSWRRQSRALAGAVARVVFSTIATAAVMSRGLAGNENDTFKTTVQAPRDRTGLPAVASAPSGCLWTSHGTTHSGTLGKAEANGVVCLSGSQSCSVGCDGRVVQKSCWNGCDLVLSSTEDDLLRELQTQCPLDLSARGAWTRDLPLVLELWIIVGAMRVVSCVHAEMCAGSKSDMR